MRSRGKRTRFLNGLPSLRVLRVFFARILSLSLSVSPSAARPDECKPSTTAPRTALAARLVPACLRSPVLQPLPTRATPAQGRRGIDIYEVRWLVASPYATFGHAGMSVSCSDSESPLLKLISSARRCSSSLRIIPVELQRADAVHPRILLLD